MCLTGTHVFCRFYILPATSLHKHTFSYVIYGDTGTDRDESAEINYRFGCIDSWRRRFGNVTKTTTAELLSYHTLNKPSESQLPYLVNGSWRLGDWIMQWFARTRCVSGRGYILCCGHGIRHLRRITFIEYRMYKTRGSHYSGKWNCS